MTPSGTDSALELDAALTHAALAGDGAAREVAVFHLRAFLVAVGWFEFARRREQLTALSTSDAARLVRDSAEEACASLLSRLGDYHGQSRFAVWMAKFAIHEVAAAARATAPARGKAEAGGDTNQGTTDERRPIHV
ncbi:MAG: hypothetical protein M3321_09005 [Actinomycetota bacterium]|nr:hypothetical protein [Actinomycetota bacterium]